MLKHLAVSAIILAVLTACTANTQDATPAPTSTAVTQTRPTAASSMPVELTGIKGHLELRHNPELSTFMAIFTFYKPAASDAEVRVGLLVDGYETGFTTGRPSMHDQLSSLPPHKVERTAMPITIAACVSTPQGEWMCTQEYVLPAR